MVEDRALGSLLESVDQTHRRTARLVAVHALQFAVDVRLVACPTDIAVDDREGGIRCPPGGLESHRVIDRDRRFRKFVDLGTGDLARSASDAECRVMKQAVASWVAVEMLDGSGVRRARTEHGPDRPCNETPT